MSENLFDQLTRLRKGGRTIRIAIGQYDPEADANHPIEGSPEVEFVIHPLTGAQATEIDRIYDEVLPPPIKELRPNTKTGQGMTEIITGYDTQSPAYLADRRRLVPRADAMTALLGCPALEESTPGSNLEEKVREVLTVLPQAAVSTIANEIRAYTYAYTGVEDFFTSGGSDSTPSSSSSETAAATPPTSPGTSASSSAEAAPSTDTTKPSKRPASGA